MYLVRKAILSAALVLGSTLGASAADLYGGGLKDAPVMAPMPAASAGWYVRVDGGYSLFQDPTISIDTLAATTNTSIDGSWSVGGGIGYYFGRGFRADVTVDHLFDSDVTGTLNCPCGDVLGEGNFSLSSTVVLANLYYDFNRGGRFNPYIGGGVGFAHNETSSGSVDTCTCTTGTFDPGSSNSFAAAAMAGVSWRIRGGQPTYVGGLKDEPVLVSNTNALYLDVGYRFLYLGDVSTGGLSFDGVAEADPEVKNIMAHQIRVGLRYDLN